MHIDIQQLLHHYGYFGVFLILFFEMIGIPFPAETTLTISGFEWSSGVFQLATLILAAALGNREVMRDKRITLTEGLG